MRDTNEWALEVIGPWGAGLDGLQASVAAALKEARLQALLDVRRGLIPISEEGVDEALVELIEAREDVSVHDTLQLGWMACFTSLNGMTLRLVREMGEKL